VERAKQVENSLNLCVSWSAERSQSTAQNPPKEPVMTSIAPAVDILLVGATGTLGSKIAHHLLADGATLQLLTRPGTHTHPAKSATLAGQVSLARAACDDGARGLLPSDLAHDLLEAALGVHRLSTPVAPLTRPSQRSGSSTSTCSTVHSWAWSSTRAAGFLEDAEASPASGAPVTSGSRRRHSARRRSGRTQKDHRCSRQPADRAQAFVLLPVFAAGRDLAASTTRGPWTSAE
jgi:hypothetical protein